MGENRWSAAQGDGRQVRQVRQLREFRSSFVIISSRSTLALTSGFDGCFDRSNLATPFNTDRSMPSSAQLGFAPMRKSNDWENLREHLEHRVIDQLNMTWLEFERASGISSTQIRKIRNGQVKRMQDGTAARLEAALGWAPGSIRRCLAGGEPELVDEERELLREPERDTESVEGASAPESPGPSDALYEDLGQRWSRFLGARFTVNAFTQLIRDFQTVQERAQRQAQQGPMNK